MPAQIAAALNQEPERIRTLLNQLVAEFERPEHGVSVKEVAGGYKMATKPEHHEAVRNFVKSLKAPLKLSLPALETLAVIAYKQPVTTPEILEIRGVQGAGVLKTLLDRKLIAEAGRKNVIGKPMLYKTTKEFLIQFGLKDLAELPSLKEFEEIRRMSMADSEIPGLDAAPAGSDALAPAELSAIAAGEAAPVSESATVEFAPAEEAQTAQRSQATASVETTVVPAGEAAPVSESATAGFAPAEEAQTAHGSQATAPVETAGVPAHQDGPAPGTTKADSAPAETQAAPGSEATAPMETAPTEEEEP